MQYQQQQQHRNSGYTVPGNREIGQGQMDQGMGMRSFHGDGMHAAAPMSRVSRVSNLFDAVCSTKQVRCGKRKGERVLPLAHIPHSGLHQSF